MNIKESVFTTDESLVKFVAKPVFSALGPKLGNDLGKVQKQIRGFFFFKKKKYVFNFLKNKCRNESRSN